jgi:hypothetical protein
LKAWLRSFCRLKFDHAERDAGDGGNDRHTGNGSRDLRRGHGPDLRDQDNEGGQHECIDEATDRRRDQHACDIAKRHGGSDQAAGPAVRLQKHPDERADAGLHVRIKKFSASNGQSRTGSGDRTFFFLVLMTLNLSQPPSMSSSKLFSQIPRPSR